MRAFEILRHDLLLSIYKTAKTPAKAPMAAKTVACGLEAAPVNGRALVVTGATEVVPDLLVVTVLVVH